MKEWCKQWGRNAVVVAKIGVLMAVPTALLVTHVWYQYQLAEVGYEIAEATDRHQQLLEENKKLKVEARLQGRTDRVAEIAREEYGLRQPGPDQFVTIDEQPDDQSGEHARLSDSSHTEPPSVSP